MTVSVIIPNYNGASFVAECIASVRSDPAVSEIVVYDDASIDGSDVLVEELAVPGLRLIRGAERIGAHAARTAAVRQAQNAVVCLLDNDDRLTPGSVSAGYKALVERQLDIAVPAMVRFSGDRPASPFIAAPTDVIEGRTAFRQTLDRWRIHPMGVMSRELYLRAAARMVGHGFSDDELFARHLFLEAKRVGGSSGIYEYRQRPKSSSPTDNIGRLRTKSAVIALALDAGVAASELGRMTNGFIRDAFRNVGRFDREQRRELSTLAANLPSPAEGWTLQDRLMRAAVRLL